MFVVRRDCAGRAATAPRGNGASREAALGSRTTIDPLATAHGARQAHELGFDGHLQEGFAACAAPTRGNAQERSAPLYSGSSPVTANTGNPRLSRRLPRVMRTAPPSGAFA